LGNKIRERHGLVELKKCADTFKHVRKIKDLPGGKFEATGTSTGVTSDTTTWMIDDLNVVDVLVPAFKNLDDIPQLKPAP
jgi:hypothetical protein